jgi:hypothetical protein
MLQKWMFCMLHQVCCFILMLMVGDEGAVELSRLLQGLVSCGLSHCVLWHAHFGVFL